MAIDTDRVISRLDEYLSRNDYKSAENHLDYWYAEAQTYNDKRAMITIGNEKIGLFRKTSQKEKALDACSSVIDLLSETGNTDSVTAGTTYINAATAYKSFGMAEEALPLYEKAKDIYEKQLTPSDARMGGLYNNMALTVTELKDYTRAKELYEKALEIMLGIKGGEGEAAITYCNLADWVYAQSGFEQTEIINCYLDKAEELLYSADIKLDGNYAFICEKCAPVFGFYGYFITEKELLKRMRSIYERA